MTTPTREQVEALDAAAALAVCEKFGFEPSNAPYIKRSPEYAMALVTLAMSAGREQGLREAKEVCEAERQEFLEQSARNDGRQSDMAFGSVNSSERIAAAIEQLRGK